MNENTNTTSTQNTNLSTAKFNFNVGKLMANGAEINDLSGSLEVTVTDRNIEVQTNGAAKFLDQISAGDILKQIVVFAIENERKSQERRDRESEARIKVEAEQTKCYAEQTKHYEKLNSKLDLEIEALQKKSEKKSAE